MKIRLPGMLVLALVADLKVGTTIGPKVGTTTGPKVGTTIGPKVGTTTGLKVGTTTGLKVGTTTGLNIVTTVGIGVATLVVPAFRPAVSAQTRTPESLAQDLQRKYDRVTDFSANFVHSYRGGVLKQQATERGTLLVKKPGKMRWEYTAPEKKLFVSDGHKIYSYIPADRQVVVGTMPRDDQAPTPALFLTGKGNLTRDFNAAFDKVAEAPAGSLALKLTPKRREPEYESLTLVVDPKTLGLQMLITVDAQGGRSAFTFTNLKENVGVADNQFVFKMPRNVDVVTDGGR